MQWRKIRDTEGVTRRNTLPKYFAEIFFWFLFQEDNLYRKDKIVVFLENNTAEENSNEQNSYLVVNQRVFFRK